MRSDGNDHDLPRAQPERPLAGKVFGEDGDHSLHRSEDGSVDHDRRLLFALVVDIAEPEPKGQLKVQLDGGALVLPEINRSVKIYCRVCPALRTYLRSASMTVMSIFGP